MESYASSSEAQLIDSSALDQNATCADDWMGSPPPDSLPRKRPRKSCLSQLLLEKAWAGLSEELRKFRNGGTSSMCVGMLGPSPCMQSSSSILSENNGMTATHHLTVLPQDGSSCARTGPLNAYQAAENEPSEMYMEEEMMSGEDECARQQGNYTDEIAACLEAIVSDVVQQCELSPSSGLQGLKQKGNKVVRFAEDCTSEKIRKTEGCTEREGDHQGSENDPPSFSIQRTLFTRRDMKEMEELLGESNKFSLIRLRRRVGLEPRRVPDLKFVTATSSSDRPIHNTPWELRSHRSTRPGSINFCRG